MAMKLNQLTSVSISGDSQGIIIIDNDQLPDVCQGNRLAGDVIASTRRREHLFAKIFMHRKNTNFFFKRTWVRKYRNLFLFYNTDQRIESFSGF